MQKLRSNVARLVFFLAAAGMLAAQPNSQVKDTRRYFAGQRLLITTRNGGPIYGTFIFLRVDFCNSGLYGTEGKSVKHTVMDNEQVNTWADRGSWDAAIIQGTVGLKFISRSGEMSFIPVRVLPNGRLWLPEGVSVVSEGSAPCP